MAVPHIRGRVLQGDPKTAAMLMPWIARRPFSRSGIPLAIEMWTKEPRTLDVWPMRKDDEIDSTVMTINGKKGSGKSTFMKSLAVRFSMLQTGEVEDGYASVLRVRIHDRKREGVLPEYERTREFLHGMSVDLGAVASINLFDRLMGMDEWDVANTSINICELLSGTSPLPDFQTLALQVGVNKMFRLRPEEVAPEVLLEYLLNIDYDDLQEYYHSRGVLKLKELQERDKELEGQAQPVEPINVPMDAFLHAAGRCAELLGDLLHGKYGQIFCGHGSIREALTSHCTLFYWHGVEDHARTLLWAQLSKWQETAERNGDLKVIPQLDIVDEWHEDAFNRMAMRFELSQTKKARSLPTLRVRGTQEGLDSVLGGSGDSELVKMGRAIDRGVAIRLVGRQNPDDEIMQYYTNTGMSARNARRLTTLRRGCFAAHIPGDDDVMWIQNILTPLELGLVSTDSAAETMSNRKAVMDYPNRYDSAQTAA